MVAALSQRKAEGKVLSRSRALNSREKRFCVLIANGWAARKAYQAATGCKNDATADTQAWRWKARPVVSAEIDKQRSQLTEATALSRAEKRNILRRVATADDTPPSVVVSAVAVDNRMTGDDEPFRKAAGDDLRVAIFVVRLGEDAAPGLPADPADAARNVTPTAGEATPNASDASAPS